jgi:hypothetical protein
VSVTGVTDSAPPPGPVIVPEKLPALCGTCRITGSKRGGKLAGAMPGRLAVIVQEGPPDTCKWHDTVMPFGASGTGVHVESVAVKLSL